MTNVKSKSRILQEHEPCVLPSLLALKVKGQGQMSSKSIITCTVHYNTYSYQVLSNSDMPK